MSEADEFFVFGQMGFSFEKLNLFGKDKLEMDFVERFLNGMFRKFQMWLDKVHRKSVVKKNPYARFFFKMLYHQMKDVGFLYFSFLSEIILNNKLKNITAGQHLKIFFNLLKYFKFIFLFR